jgi:SAM-dependent methyltransferase
MRQPASLALQIVRGSRTVADFYGQVETAIPVLDRRLHIFLEEYQAFRAQLGRRLRLLDIGCGRRAVIGANVDSADEYCACDIVQPLAELSCFAKVNLNEESVADIFSGRFDVVFCGEVIEHLFSPDALLEDVRTLLEPHGLLLISTPNLAYWANRLLLLAGISPLFVENSARVKLGRRFRSLGQASPTQGHVRLFTHSAMRDFLALHGFEVLRARAVPVWPFAIDRIVCRFSSSLAPDNVYVARLRP